MTGSFDRMFVGLYYDSLWNGKNILSFKKYKLIDFFRSLLNLYVQYGNWGVKFKQKFRFLRYEAVNAGVFW